MARSAVGEFSVDSWGIFVELGEQLRRLAGVEGVADPAIKALEAFALVSRGKLEADSSQQLEEEKQRLLVRLYLKRLVDILDRQPISESELEAAHRAERQHALSSGESEICIPTRLDAAAVLVGYFPDLHTPSGDNNPLLDRKSLLELAAEIHDRARAAPDVDAFWELGRRYQASHPSVILQDFHRLPRGQVPGGMHAGLYRSLWEGSVDGLLERVYEFDFGAAILWRIGNRPGRGEKLDEVREEITALVRRQHRREAVSRHIKRLLQNSHVQVFYERLSPDGADGYGR